MTETFSKVEVITGVDRRGFETPQPGMSIGYVARRYELSPSLAFRWRRLMKLGR